MVDETVNGGESADSVCPWCSATYAGDPDTCPSCGAALAVDPTTDPALPGLTAIDTAAIVRAKAPVARPRNRLLSWISGDYPDETATVAEAGALAPPDQEVRREMLRLELEAEVANLQAEADALRAEATVEGRGPGAVEPVDGSDAALAPETSAPEALAADAGVPDAAIVADAAHVEPRGTEPPAPL
jgi:hypothetical protein